MPSPETFLVSTRDKSHHHHVAEPWWQNDELKEALDQGVEPVIAEMTAYFPGIANGIAVNNREDLICRDVACRERKCLRLGIKQIALADSRRSTVSGGPVVLVGYPTALMQFWLGPVQKRSSPSRRCPRVIRSR